MHSTNALRVPAPLAMLLQRLPAYPGSFLLVQGLNRVLRSSLPDDVCDALQGKRLRLTVTDAQLTFDFAWQRSRFVAEQPGAEPDLTISACAYDFWQLAQRQQDPDTLFFNRRLSMQGDTELGLLLKNTFDAMELPLLALLQSQLSVAPWASSPPFSALRARLRV